MVPVVLVSLPPHIYLIGQEKISMKLGVLQ
jgi:hypothetical protein